jgi:hypothetical protein
MSEQNQNISDQWVSKEANGDGQLMDLIKRREELFLDAAQLSEHRSGYKNSGDQNKQDVMVYVQAAIIERKNALGIDRLIEP